MIRRSGHRFADRIMRQRNFLARDRTQNRFPLLLVARPATTFHVCAIPPGSCAPHITPAREPGRRRTTMTPQERQMMAELFNRLASLENSPRDPDAEAMIREGFRRAPNAAYALVQTVLLQDEALKAANAHIQEYEQQYGGPQQQQERTGEHTAGIHRHP